MKSKVRRVYCVIKQAQSLVLFLKRIPSCHPNKQVNSDSHPLAPIHLIIEISLILLLNNPVILIVVNPITYKQHTYPKLHYKSIKWQGSISQKPCRCRMCNNTALVWFDMRTTITVRDNKLKRQCPPPMEEVPERPIIFVGEVHGWMKKGSSGFVHNPEPAFLYDTLTVLFISRSKRFASLKRVFGTWLMNLIQHSRHWCHI